MDALIARRTWRTLEPIHGMIYFVPEAGEHYRRAGLDDQQAGYFASRAAPLGEASAELVIATFYNFSPALVRAAIPAAWMKASPGQLIEARRSAAGQALRRCLGGDATGDQATEAAVLARRAALVACDHLEGRPLFACHARLPWPEDPLLVLWHAQTLLREFRGDGHVTALAADGVSGIEALVMHAATGEIGRPILQATRQWDDAAWAAAVEGLTDRGWLHDDGSFTETGRAHRQEVEDRTDRLAVAPYRALGEDGCAQLRRLARPLSRAIIDAGGLSL